MLALSGSVAPPPHHDQVHGHQRQHDNNKAGGVGGEYQDETLDLLATIYGGNFILFSSAVSVGEMVILVC